MGDWVLFVTLTFVAQPGAQPFAPIVFNVPGFTSEERCKTASRAIGDLFQRQSKAQSGIGGPRLASSYSQCLELPR